MNIGILFGGKSAEHEVSCISAYHVYTHMDQTKYRPILIGITKNGAFRYYDQDPNRLLSGDWEPYANDGEIDWSGDGGRILLKEGQTIELDVLFPVLHGPFGEDGRLQGMLDYANIRYVGAGVLCSAISMDKGMMKDILKANAIPQTEYIVLKKNDDIKEETIAHLKFPLFVKPANLGSSVGISKVNTFEECADAVERARAFDKRVIIEEGVFAREIEVAVMETEQELLVSKPGELHVVDEFYDYEAKYTKNETTWQIPADLPAELCTRIRQLAKDVFQLLDGRGIARVDFFIEKETDRILVNEINTMPGFTPISMYPKLWMAEGLSYQEIINRLVSVALEDYEQKK